METVEERCIVNLIETLEGISVVDGYQTDVLNVHRMTGTNQDVLDKPAIIVDHRGVQRSSSQVSMEWWDLRLALMLTIDMGDGWESRLSRFIGDVYRALTVDHHRGTFGGQENAFDTLITGDATANLDDGFPSPVAQVDVLVRYRHLYGDPFTSV